MTDDQRFWIIFSLSIALVLSVIVNIALVFPNPSVTRYSLVFDEGYWVGAGAYDDVRFSFLVEDNTPYIFIDDATHAIGRSENLFEYFYDYGGWGRSGGTIVVRPTWGTVVIDLHDMFLEKNGYRILFSVEAWR